MEKTIGNTEFVHLWNYQNVWTVLAM